jgi:DNA repair photolyase/predicted DNA-binding protein (UPF0251 family)
MNNLHAESDRIVKGVEKGGRNPIAGTWPNAAVITVNNFKYKSLSDFSLNTAVGCSHGCRFCYVPSTSAIKQAPKLNKLGVNDPDAEWGQYVFVRNWDEKAFLASLIKAEGIPVGELKADGNRAVMLCTTTDPYQVIKHSDPQEAKKLTETHRANVHRMLELIRDNSTLNVRILTRSPLAKQDFDLMKSYGNRLVFGMSLPTLDNNLARIYEPNAPAPSKRLETLQAARAAGLHVYVAIAPTYPECDEADLRATLTAIKELDLITIFHEPINIRAENVERIRAHGEELGVKLNTEVFATVESWEDYALAQLHLVERVAGELGLLKHLHLWPDKSFESKRSLARHENDAGHVVWLRKWWDRVSEWPGYVAVKPAAAQFAPSEDDDESLETTIARLAALSPIDYDRSREAEAKRLKIRVATLDTQVELQRPRVADAPLQGQEVVFPQVEPWPEPVDGADVLNKVSETFSKYIVLPPGGADALALWCAHAHAFEAFECTPRLNIRSPEKGCGKTLTLEVTQLFVPRPLRMENCTVAVLFRLVDKFHPVLLADECDTWMKDKNELLGLFNAGHRRGGKVMRCEGDGNDVRAFKVYAPTALGGIGALPGTLHDRSVVIMLHRAKPGEVRARFDSRHVESEQELCRKLARFAADNLERLKNADPALPDGVYNRLADNWRPLFAIAEAAGGDWPKRAADALASLTAKDGAEGQSDGVQLLDDIREIFEEKIVKDKIPGKDLAEALAGMPGRPWAEFGRTEKPITPTKLARMLGHFEIKSGTQRDGNVTFKGYCRTDFNDAFGRYLFAKA